MQTGNNLKKYGKYLIAFLCIAFIAGIFFVVKPFSGKKESEVDNEVKEMLASKPESIKDFHNNFFKIYMSRDAEYQSILGNLEAFGIKPRNDELTNVSCEHDEETYEIYKKSLRDLKSYDRGKQTEDELLTTDAIQWFLEDALNGQKFMYHSYPINQFNGIQCSIVDFMMNYNEIKNKDDAENYIKRVSSIKEKFSQALEAMKAREKKGIIPPSYVIDATVKQIDQITGASPKQNAIYTSFKERLSQIKNMDDKEKESLCKKVEDEIKSSVSPAYKTMKDYLKKLREKAPKEVGYWKQPEGDEYYAYILRHFTTTNLTPEEVHNLGLQKVQEIKDEMTPIFKELNIPTDNFGYALNCINTENYNRETSVDEMKKIIADTEKKLPEMFEIFPKSKVDVIPVPSFMESTFPNGYQTGTIDGSRPGVFYLNLSMSWQRHRMLPLAYHEAIPGHHFQLSLQMENEELSPFRKINNSVAYVEGWALYSERLADEYGLYKDGRERIGYLQSQLMRAVRLVIDTGIHYKKWTREQAMSYFYDNMGYNNPGEIDRYIVYPGQACSYMIGELKILELREKAKSELGDKFNIKEFHTAVLKDGALPLSMLENQVQKYIDSKKKN